MTIRLASMMKSEKKMINVRVTPEQKKQIVENAKKYCGGNISQWLIYSGTKLHPKKKDLVDL